MSEPAVRWEAQAREIIAIRSRAFEAAFARGDIEALVAEYFVADDWGPMASPPGGQAPDFERVARYAVCWLYRDQAWRALVDFFAEDGWR